MDGVRGLAGAITIETGTSALGGAQDLIVKAGQMSHELICDEPPLFVKLPNGTLRSFLFDWQTQYASQCHELTFEIKFHSGAVDLLSAPLKKTPQATVRVCDQYLAIRDPQTGQTKGLIRCILYL